MAKRRIGILTGGGDVPGLNSVIKSVVYRGFQVAAATEADQTLAFGLCPHCGSALARAVRTLNKAH